MFQTYGRKVWVMGVGAFVRHGPGSAGCIRMHAEGKMDDSKCKERVSSFRGDDLWGRLSFFFHFFGFCGVWLYT